MLAIGPLGLALGGLALGSTVYGAISGKKDERRARAYEGEALEYGKRIGERGKAAFRRNTVMEDLRSRYLGSLDKWGAADYAGQMAGRTARYMTEEARPEFERGLRESVGNVVGGLGRRGGLVERTVGEAGERFAQSAANVAGSYLPTYLDYQSREGERAFQGYSLENTLARMDENQWLELLGVLSDVEQSRANSKRRGFAGLGTNLATLATLA